MIPFIDTEGQPIPKDILGNPLFEIATFDDNEGIGPVMYINVPNTFVWGPVGVEEVYDSEGVLKASIQDVLEDYLVEGCDGDALDGGRAFANWLREYADRLEVTAADCPKNNSN